MVLIPGVHVHTQKPYAWEKDLSGLPVYALGSRQGLFSFWHKQSVNFSWTYHFTPH